MNDCCSAVFNSLHCFFPVSREGQCHFHMLKQVKKDCPQCLKVKENIHRALADLKMTQNFAFSGMADLMCGLLKKKYSNEIAFFY